MQVNIIATRCEFDRDSIMLYAIPEELTVGTWSVGWNRTLSKTDKAFAAAQYPGKVEPPQKGSRRLPIEHYDRATNREKIKVGDVILTAGRDREDFAEVRLLGRFRNGV